MATATLTRPALTTSIRRMTAARKLCLVGEPGVGKSTLVGALMRALAPEDALTAADRGPGITLTDFDLAEGEPMLVTLWDVAGASALDSLNQAFLSGLDGIVAVADAARPATAATALRLVAQIRRLYPGTPAVLLINKRDLAAPAQVPVDPAAHIAVFETSAVRGENVREAIAALAAQASRSMSRGRVA